MNPHDEEAFRVFVDTRSRALLHTARLLTGEADGAEDLVQESLARLIPPLGAGGDAGGLCPGDHAPAADQPLAAARIARRELDR